MFKENFLQKVLLFGVCAFFFILAGCSDTPSPDPENLDGTWYLNVEQSFRVMEKEEKGRLDELKTRRLESVRGMMLVFDMKNDKLTIIANEEEREDLAIRHISREKDGAMILYMKNEKDFLRFRFLDEKTLEFDSRFLGPIIFTTEAPGFTKSGMDGIWYFDVEESLLAKRSLPPGEQRAFWLLHGASLDMDMEKGRMIGHRPGSEQREYVLNKVSDHVFNSDMDEYGKVSLRFFPDGSLKLSGYLPVDLILSRKKPEEYALSLLNGTWNSDPDRTRSTHPAVREAVEAFSIVVDTGASTIHFIAGEEEKTIPFQFSPEKGKVFHATSEGYEGEILMILEKPDILKMLSDNLVVVFNRAK